MAFPSPRSRRSRRSSPALWLATLVAFAVVAPAVIGGMDDPGPATQVAVSGTVGANGWWTSSVTVTLTCSPGAYPCASTEYRFGAGPWTAYSAPVAIQAEGHHALEARSSDSIGQVGASTLRSLFVDVVPPTSSHAINGPTGSAPWYTGPVTVTLNCTDTSSGCAATRYSLNGAPSTTYGGPIGLSSDGIHTIRYRGEDVAGLRDPVQTATAQLDQVAPDIALTHACDQPGDSGWCRGTVTRAATASDDTSGVASLTCSADGMMTACDTTLIGTSTLHTFLATATDAAGLMASASESIRVDPVAPTTSVTLTGTLAPDGWFVSAVSVSLLCGDDLSGCKTSEYRLNDGPWNEYQEPFLVETPGTHVLAARSTDLAGNVATAQTRNVAIDLGPFELMLGTTGTLGDGDWFHSPVEVAVQCQKHTLPCPDVRTRTDGGTEVAYAAPFTVTGDARHEVVAASYATDGSQDTIASALFGIDRVAPTIQFGTGCSLSGEAGWCRGDLPITVTSQDATSGIAMLSCWVDEVPSSCGPFTLPSEGIQTLRAATRDHAGHDSVATITVRRDVTPPVLGLDAPCFVPGDNGWCRGPITIAPVFSDPISGILLTECYLNGVAFPCGPRLLALDGVYTVALHASDVAGNQAIKTFKVKIDQTAPDLTIDARCPSGFRSDWCGSTVQLVGAAADRRAGVASLICTLDGAATPCATTHVSEEGFHLFRVTSRDHAGNEATSSRAFSVDTHAPELARITPVAGCSYIDDQEVACTELATTALGPLTIAGTARDNLSGLLRADIIIDGSVRASFTTGSFAWEWDTANELPGRHSLLISGFDVAGNRSDLALVVTVVA